MRWYSKLPTIQGSLNEVTTSIMTDDVFNRLVYGICTHVHTCKTCTDTHTHTHTTHTQINTCSHVVRCSLTFDLATWICAHLVASVGYYHICAPNVIRWAIR